jgi:hypothetical protein
MTGLSDPDVCWQLVLILRGVQVPLASFEASPTITHSHTIVFKKNVIISYTAVETSKLTEEEKSYCLV